MALVTKGKFNVALNDQGFILQGMPGTPSYAVAQAPVYGTRFASGDRNYNDLSQWWFFAQTDWSGGIKDTVSWSDDAKYYYSTNIDTWSEAGAVKLSRKPYPTGAGGDHDFTDDVICGVEGTINGSLKKAIGSGESSDSRPHIYTADSGESQTFTDISTTTISTLQDKVSQLSVRLDVLWASMIGAGSTSPSLYSVATWHGSWTDQAAHVQSVLSVAYFNSRCHCEYGGAMYVFVDGDNQVGLAKTIKDNPTADADWTKVFQSVNDNAVVVAAAGYNGNIYYLKNYTTYMELWQYNIAAATNALFQRFNNTNAPTYGVGDKLLVNFNGKLIVTIPDNEIWQLDSATLTRIYIKDEFKRGGSTLAEIDAYLTKGCVVQENKCWWGNFSYDGDNFFNTWKNDADSTSNQPYPLFADSAQRIWESHTGDISTIWSVNLIGAHYKGTADKNFIVLSNFDLMPSLDKLPYSATVLFKPLITGQSLVVEYLFGEYSTSATWSVLGTASFAVDGGTVRDKTFFFPVGSIFKKIWFRVKLNSGGSDTPTMTDFVMNYLPIPDYRKQWVINLNCADDLLDLDDMRDTRTGREMSGFLEKAWLTKEIQTFQDINYAATQLNGAITNASVTLVVDDTRDFPEYGRLVIDSEEIFYTGKTPKSFTGCTRGKQSSIAIAHADNSAVYTGLHRVIITNYEQRIPVLQKDKLVESIVQLTIRETGII